MSPASTHSLSSEIHWLAITHWSDWLQGRVWRQNNTSDFKLCFWDCVWFTAVLKRKYSAMLSTYELSQFVLKHIKITQINNIKKLDFKHWATKYILRFSRYCTSWRLYVIVFEMLAPWTNKCFVYSFFLNCRRPFIFLTANDLQCHTLLIDNRFH